MNQIAYFPEMIDQTYKNGSKGTEIGNFLNYPLLAANFFPDPIGALCTL